MADIELPFGLRDDILVHISQVQQGLACGCVCPQCKKPLVARSGSVLVHHFAHYRKAAINRRTPNCHPKGLVVPSSFRILTEPAGFGKF